MSCVPRPANSEELQQLLQYCLEDLDTGPNPSQAILNDQRHFINISSISVFDNYTNETTRKPWKYHGKVMVVVWAILPSTVQSFKWRDGKMVLAGGEPVEYWG